MTPGPKRSDIFIAAMIAAASLGYNGPRDFEFQHRLAREPRRRRHTAGAWSGDGVQPAETRQMRRARERAASKRKAVGP